jgi:integrase
VIAACPDAEWRLIFALSRYGGLRCPSEHLALRWGDIDWERNRMRVPSPKTEHHPGGESRIVPIYPELRPYLEEVWEQAKPGTEYVITRYRETNVNLRSRLLDIIWSAGIKEWPKLFQNLRSTRQTELSEKFPAHVVCKWMGNSKPIADRHYLQTTEAHFARAVAGDHVAQNAAQQPAESARKGSQSLSRNPNFPAECDSLRTYTRLQVAEAGLEPARPITGTGF